MRTSVKNRVHALLARQGIRSEHTDLFGKSGREFLAGLELPDGPRQRLDSLTSLIADFDREITATTSRIDARASTDARVRVLCQIRGVGRYTTMPIIAEVGDVTRFPTARHRCVWTGLAPTVRSSDGKARLGHISRQGSPALRWALTEPRRRSPPAAGRYGPPSSGSPNRRGRRWPDAMELERERRRHPKVPRREASRLVRDRFGAGDSPELPRKRNSELTGNGGRTADNGAKLTLRLLSMREFPHRREYPAELLRGEARHE